MYTIPMFGQAATAGAVGSWVIWFVLIAAIVGIGLVAARAAGVVVPPWVATIGWIVVVAFVAIVAIQFLVRVAGGGP